MGTYYAAAAQSRYYTVKRKFLIIYGRQLDFLSIFSDCFLVLVHAENLSMICVKSLTMIVVESLCGYQVAASGR